MRPTYQKKKNLGETKLSQLLTLFLQFDKISGALLEEREIFLRNYLGASTPTKNAECRLFLWSTGCQ